MTSSLAVVALLMSQVPATESAVAVIPTNPTPLGQRLEARLMDALVGASVPLQPLTAIREKEAVACETNRLCFALLGRLIGAHAVMRVEGAVVGSDVAVLIEQIDSASGKVLREESFVIAVAADDAEITERMKPLAARVHDALPPPRPIALVAEPKPEPDLPPAVLTTTPVQPKSGVPLWVTGTGAIVFAGASAGLFAISASARSCLQGPAIDGRPTVCVPHAQAAGVQQRADLGAIAGTAAGAVAVGLAVTALVQFLAN